LFREEEEEEEEDKEIEFMDGGASEVGCLELVR